MKLFAMNVKFRNVKMNERNEWSRILNSTYNRLNLFLINLVEHIFTHWISKLKWRPLGTTSSWCWSPSTRWSTATLRTRKPTGTYWSSCTSPSSGRWTQTQSPPPSSGGCKRSTAKSTTSSKFLQFLTNLFSYPRQIMFQERTLCWIPFLIIGKFPYTKENTYLGRKL